MKAMKLLNWLLIPSLAVAMTACTDSEELEGNGHGYNEATFYLEEVSVENTSATVKASVTGNMQAPYICFFTDDVTSPASEVVSAYLKTITVTRHILHTGTTTHSQEGLRQGGKQYRCIMTGLLANGRVYNDPVVLDFVTKGDYQKANWSVTRPNADDQPTLARLEGIQTDYVYGLVTKAEWDATDIKTIVNAELDSESYTVTSGDKDLNLPISEPGDYVLYVYGVDEQKAPTLDYAVLEFHVDKIDYSAYEAFIGTWYDAQGQSFVISEDVKGASFKVKGFDKDIVAGYTGGTIKFYFSEGGTDQASGFPTYLFGYDQDDYLEDASQNDKEEYLLATGVISNDEIVLTGETYQAVYSGETYDEIIVALQVFAFDSSSNKIYEVGNGVTLSLKDKLTKQGSDPATPVSYEDFLGKWSVTRGSETDIWTISQDEAGKSFIINGLESVDGIPVTALYDSKNSALLIPDQIVGNINDPDLGSMEVSVHGKILYQGKEYFVTSSDYNDPYIIGTGVMSANKGTISLNPETVNISGIGELDIIGLQMFGEVLEGTNKGKVYGFSEDYTTLPNSLTRSAGKTAPSACSVKAVRSIEEIPSFMAAPVESVRLRRNAR